MLPAKRQRTMITRIALWFLIWSSVQTIPSVFGGRAEPAFQQSDDGAVILSDTQGYEFGPYLSDAVMRIRKNWYALIPRDAQQGAKARIAVTFTILADGMVKDVKVTAGSEAKSLERAATGAILLSSPFAKLPGDFKGDHLELRFTFSYNMN